MSLEMSCPDAYQTMTFDGQLAVRPSTSTSCHNSSNGLYLHDKTQEQKQKMGKRERDNKESVT
jgi:hypothetical protein